MICADQHDTVGSGYTVEGQKTGEEKHGGLQLEIIPSYQANLRSWVNGNFHIESSALEDVYGDPFRNSRLDEKKTPRQLGLSPENTLSAYPRQAYKAVPCTISDVAAGIREGVPLSVSLIAFVDEYGADLRLEQAVYPEISLHGWRCDAMKGQYRNQYPEAEMDGVSLGWPAASPQGFAGSAQAWGMPAAMPPPKAAAQQMGQLPSAYGSSHLQSAAKASYDLDTDAAMGPEDAIPEVPETITTAQLKTMGLAAGGKLST